VEHFKSLARLHDTILVLAILTLVTGSNATRSSGHSAECAKSFSLHEQSGCLTLDERMELERGMWGRSSIHPLGPDFYRYQRRKNEGGSPSSVCRLSVEETGRLLAAVDA